MTNKSKMGIREYNVLPKELCVEQEHKNIYKELLRGEGDFQNSPFVGMQMHDIFLLSFAIGVTRGVRKPLLKAKPMLSQQVIASSGIGALVVAFFLSTKDPDDVLGADPEEMKSTVEEFSNAGLEILVDHILSARGETYLELEDKWRLFINDALQMVSRLGDG